MIQRVSEDERGLGVTGLAQMRGRVLEKVLEGRMAPHSLLEPTKDDSPSSVHPRPHQCGLNRGPSIVRGRSDWFRLDDKFTPHRWISERQLSHRALRHCGFLSRRSGPSEMPRGEGEVRPSREMMQREEEIRHRLPPK